MCSVLWAQRREQPVCVAGAGRTELGVREGPVLGRGPRDAGPGAGRLTLGGSWGQVSKQRLSYYVRNRVLGGRVCIALW